MANSVKTPLETLKRRYASNMLSEASLQGAYALARGLQQAALARTLARVLSCQSCHLGPLHSLYSSALACSMDSTTPGTLQTLSQPYRTRNLLDKPSSLMCSLLDDMRTADFSGTADD